MPKVIDFDELIAGMIDMLRRTLGEMIKIETKITPELWRIGVDPNQLENAVLNLAINARDAMEDGGELVIETANITFTEAPDGEAMGAEPGDYVMLAVSDTGIGIAPQVQEHVFEPFFTTKEVGQGSGLGLSMVYGFASQSGGFVSIDSDVGRGTTVKLFLPRTKDATPRIAREAVPREPTARGETVLLVEDEAGVRTLAATLLGGLGYTVVEASDGDTALAALASDAAIDLLFTDVVLPGAMSGPQVAEEARRRNPNIKVLFMSGYPDKMPHHQDLSDDAVELLAKPFSKREMARKVRSALDQQKHL